MRKPSGRGNHALKRLWFGGASAPDGPKAPHSLVVGGAAPLSRNLAMGDPDFGGCKWPTSPEGEPVQFCCAPATGRFCAVHLRRGVVAIPKSGKGSLADFLRGVERFI